MNAIFHNGLCIENGHYTSMCREETSSIWIEIDDTQIEKSNGPEVLRISIYYFYKKLLLKTYIKRILNNIFSI